MDAPVTSDLRRRPAVARVLDRAQDDPDVLAVILFGSRARGEATPGSDIDLCLVLDDRVADDLARSQRRLDYLALADLDLVVFQQLPLYIRSRLFGEGVVLYVRDEDALYDLAIRTARAFERFRPRYRLYLDEVARG